MLKIICLAKTSHCNMKVCWEFLKFLASYSFCYQLAYCKINYNSGNLSTCVTITTGIRTGGRGHGPHRVLEVCLGPHTTSVYWLLNTLASYISYLVQLPVISVMAIYSSKKLLMNSQQFSSKKTNYKLFTSCIINSYSTQLHKTC